MKYRNSMIWAIVSVGCLTSASSFGTIHFNDGGIHNINYEINDEVWVDYETPSMYTTLNWLDGAYTNFLRGYENSKINIRRGGRVHWLASRDSGQVSISGGSIYELDCFDSSQVSISSGFVDELLSYGSSRVNIYSGSMESISSRGSSQVNIYGGGIDYLASCYSSLINISGGSIDELKSYDSGQINLTGGSIHGDLELWGQSKIQIFGSDFEVDGQPFGYGELTSILGRWPSAEPLRHLTGTLAHGSILDNDFRIGHTSKIILIPEPATLLLLALGNLLLRRKR